MTKRYVCPVCNKVNSEFRIDENGLITGLFCCMTYFPHPHLEIKEEEDARLNGHA